MSQLKDVQTSSGSRVSALDAFRKTLFYPALLLSAGNMVLAAATGNPVGLVIQIASTAFIAYRCFTAFKQNKDPVLPFVVLGLVNLTSAGIGLIDGLFIGEAAENLRTVIIGNLALAGWGVGHLFTAREIATKKRPENLVTYNMTWYGAADLSAIAANPAGKFNLAAAPVNALGAAVSFSLAAIGTVKSLFYRNTEPAKEGSLNWHLGPARFYGAGYALNGALAAGVDPLFALASFCWALGVWNFDSEQNIALRRGISRKLGLIKKTP